MFAEIGEIQISMWINKPISYQANVYISIKPNKNQVSLLKHNIKYKGI